jgi:DNA-binding NtrC family response regulator
MKSDTEVMVLDDEDVVCERLREFLSKKGMAVETFTDSSAALERLKGKRFDVIVTDVKMEGPTGMDVLMAVKQLGYDSEVIMITGYGTFESMREAEAVGVFAYIGKPFKMSDMHNLIKKAARGARRQSS